MTQRHWKCSRCGESGTCMDDEWPECACVQRENGDGICAECGEVMVEGGCKCGEEHIAAREAARSVA